MARYEEAVHAVVGVEYVGAEQLTRLVADLNRAAGEAERDAGRIANAYSLAGGGMLGVAQAHRVMLEELRIPAPSVDAMVRQLEAFQRGFVPPQGLRETQALIRGINEDLRKLNSPGAALPSGVIGRLRGDIASLITQQLGMASAPVQAPTVRQVHQGGYTDLETRAGSFRVERQPNRGGYGVLYPGPTQQARAAAGEYDRVFRTKADAVAAVRDVLAAFGAVPQQSAPLQLGPSTDPSILGTPAQQRVNARLERLLEQQARDRSAGVTPPTGPVFAPPGRGHSLLPYEQTQLFARSLAAGAQSVVDRRAAEANLAAEADRAASALRALDLQLRNLQTDMASVLGAARARSAQGPLALPPGLWAPTPWGPGPIGQAQVRGRAFNERQQAQLAASAAVEATMARLRSEGPRELPRGPREAFASRYVAQAAADAAAQRASAQRAAEFMDRARQQQAFPAWMQDRYGGGFGQLGARQGGNLPLSQTDANRWAQFFRGLGPAPGVFNVTSMNMPGGPRSGTYGWGGTVFGPGAGTPYTGPGTPGAGTNVPPFGPRVVPGSAQTVPPPMPGAWRRYWYGNNAYNSPPGAPPYLWPPGTGPTPPGGAGAGGGGAPPIIIPPGGGGPGGGGFRDDFTRGFRGRADRSYAEQLGQTFKFALFYGTAYKILFTLTQTLQVGLDEAIKFQQGMAELSIATGRSAKANEDLARHLGDQAAAVGQSPSLGLEVGARAIGLYDLHGAGQAVQEAAMRRANTVVQQLQFTTGRKPEQIQLDVGAISQAFDFGYQSINQVADLDAYFTKRFGIRTGQTLETVAQVGSLGAQAGFNAEEVFAIAGKLQSRTGQTPAAVAGLLSQIFSRSGEGSLQGQFQKLGIDVTLPFREQLAALSVEYQTMSAGQRQQLTSSFGRGRSQGAAAILLEDFGEIASGAQAARSEAGGASEEQFRIRMNNVGGQLAALAGQFNLFAVELANSGILAAFAAGVITLREFLEAVTNVLRMWNEFPAALRNAIGALAVFALAAKLGAVRGVVGGLATRGGLAVIPAGVSATGRQAFFNPATGAAATSAVGAARIAGAGGIVSALGGPVVLGALATFGVLALGKSTYEKLNAASQQATDALISLGSINTSDPSSLVSAATALDEAAKKRRDLPFGADVLSFFGAPVQENANREAEQLEANASTYRVAAQLREAYNAQEAELKRSTTTAFGDLSDAS